MRQDKDRCGKWLIDSHGDAILKLANISGFVSWRAVQSELVAPRRLPDGLIEATFPNQSQPDLFIIEIETYVDRSIAPQVFEDILLTRLERGVVPDTIVLVLRPKGKIDVERQITESSQHALTTLGASWRVIELWKLNAEDLLAANEVGLIPWIPLTRFSGPPELLLRQCRERIDQQAKPEEHEALLVVTTLLASVVFDDDIVLAIFGGAKKMIESPLLDRLLAQRDRQTKQADILRFLKSRFGNVPGDLAEKVRSADAVILDDLIDFAGSCSNLESFALRLKAN